VLLENDLIVIDLKSDGYPQFEHHHQINLHESPITFFQYLVDPNWQLYQHLVLASQEKGIPTQSSASSNSNSQQSSSNVPTSVCSINSKKMMFILIN
jgi:hypothetical protein